MAQDDSGNILNTEKRFEIFVPNPKARINLGKRNQDTTGPFGYDGVSIQSDVHLFIDANKHTLFQTGQNYCGQVGGKWLQYANADMVMSSTATMNVSASKKIVIASGAGQGQVTALDHGGVPAAVPYNALELHYRVDRLQTSLFEFFHGRRERAEITSPKLLAVLKAGGLEDDTKYFDGKKAGSNQKQTVAKLAGGFVWNTADSLRELYPVKARRDVPKFGEDAKEAGDPILHLDPLVTQGVFGKDKAAKSLKHGSSAYLKRFDPYRLLDKEDATGPVGKGLVGFLNTITQLKRFLDVTEKYAWLLTDNFLMKRVQAAFGAYTSLVGAFSAAYGLVKMPFGSFANPQAFPAFQDEASSSFPARFGGDSVGSAADGASSGAAEKKAKVQSARGPWDLSSGASTFTVKWGDESAPETATVDLGSATPAELEVSVTHDALPALAATVTVSPAGLPQGTAWADVKPLLAQTLGLVEADLDHAETTGASVTLSGAKAYDVLCTDFGATELLEANGQTITPASIGFAASFRHVTGTVQLSVDGGAAQAVTLDTSQLSRNVQLDAHAQARFGGALSGVSAGAVADGAFTLTTASTGPGASIEVVTGDAWVYEALGLGGGQVVRGQAPLDLSQVTADDLAARIPAKAGLSVSASGGTVSLEAPFDEGTDPRSYVEVSGGPTETVFGSDPAKDEVTADDVSDFQQGVAGFEAGLAQLKSWNHELGKLPEDTRNLTRPIRNAVTKVISTVSGVESAVEKAVETVGSPLLGLPSAPESIGLIADSGITLGTRDRIVGAGGKGVVFVCDGGTGAEDHAKFIKGYESFVNLALKWDPIDAALKKAVSDGDDADDALDSLGFRVLSNDTVDLFGTHAAQLMALGRAKLKSPTVDGKQIAGVGVARLAGSYAAEVAGYRKVVISARNRGDDDTKGGRVEVAGQTIAIGGMNVQGDTKDFLDRKGFGVEPLEVDSLAGAELLSDAQKRRLAKELAKNAWTETLRKGGDDGHPNTKRVFVHAEKETVIQVGTWLVHVDATKGVTIGTRKPNADPTTNEVDDQKPTLVMDDQKIELVAKKDGATLTMEGDETTIKKGDNDLVIGANGIESKNKKFVMKGDSVDIQGKRDYKIGAQNVSYKFKGTFKIG